MRIRAIIVYGILLTLSIAACSSLLPGVNPTPTTPPPTPTTQITGETEAAPPPSEQPPTEVPRCELGTDVFQDMDAIEDQVAVLRGIQPLRSVERTLLTQTQLRQRVMDDFLADISEEEAMTDTRVLALFGLLEPDFDLWSFYADLYTEQIAGFYDDDSEEMAVICGADFGGPERITYAHEFTHALQDQMYDLDEGLGYNDEQCEADSERCAAIQALVEGDASLLEEQWFRTYATEDDLTELMEFYAGFEMPVYESAPRFMREDFLFPYLAGRTFVQTLYLEGGWAAVDQAYLNPPLSTEQILHPERYPSDVPVWLEVPDLATALGGGWREIDRNVLGEWYTQLTLNEFIPKRDAADAAEGWAGDYYLALHDEDTSQTALVLVTQWDTIRDQHEFDAAFRSYADARFGEPISSSTYEASWLGNAGYALFERVSNQTLWILTPDEPIGQALRKAVVFPAPQQ